MRILSVALVLQVCSLHSCARVSVASAHSSARDCDFV